VSFEERFFGPGNAIRFSRGDTGSLNAQTAARLQPFLDEYRRGVDVCTLPRVDAEGSTTWYVLCRTAREERLARHEVRAFVGPSYSLFDGQSRELVASDGVEAAVLDHWGTTSFLVEVPSTGSSAHANREKARERLSLWLRLRRERPVRVGARARPTGRILRDFEYAVLAGDDATAVACIEELRSFGRLDARNLRFLEVRRLASGEQWDAIRNLPEFDSLLAVRRPRRATEALIESIYFTELAVFERNRDPSEALVHFRQQVRPLFGDLYRSRRGLSADNGAVAASFVLMALTDEPPRPDAAGTIIDGFAGPTAVRTWLESVAAAGSELAPKATEVMPLTPSIGLARAAFAAGDVDRAVDLAAALEPSFDQASLLLRCATEIGTVDLAQCGADAVKRLDETTRTALVSHPRVGRIYADVLELIGAAQATADTKHDEPVNSWADWLRRLTAERIWPSAVVAAEQGSRDWQIYESDPAHILELSELISAKRAIWGEEALRDGSPYLIEALLRDGPRGSLLAVYEGLLLLLLTDPTPSLASLRMLIRLVEARLTLSVDPGSYGDYVDGMGVVIERLSSPAICDVALEALEAVICVPVVDRGVIERLVARVVGLFGKWYRRVEPLQWSLLRRCADELGLVEIVPERSPESSERGSDELSEVLSERSLAIYSLNERALMRAASSLREAYPDLDVSTFHDHVGGSQALKTASSRADIFVVAVASAKHAATGYIAQNRSRDRLTLYARGHGSAGLLSVIRENVSRIRNIGPRRP
jgi:hypothetical protein